MKQTSQGRPETALRRTKADRATAARFVEMLRSGVDLRERKARRTRAAIKVRSYENDLKLEVAIERLLDELAPLTVGSLR